jgi:hypothetical protein
MTRRDGSMGCASFQMGCHATDAAHSMAWAGNRANAKCKTGNAKCKMDEAFLMKFF